MSNNPKRSFTINILLGTVIGMGIIAGVVLLAPLELKAFWAASVIGLLIFAITLSDTRKSNREINTKLDQILFKLGINSVNELSKKENEATKKLDRGNQESVTMKRKCWFKAKGYQ